MCNDPLPNDPLTGLNHAEQIRLMLDRLPVSEAAESPYAAMAWARRRTVRTVMSSSWPNSLAASAM